MSVLSGKKIVLGISGGIAAFKTAALVRLFVKAGAQIQVIMTPASKDFITPLTLSTLSNNPVYSTFYDEENENDKAASSAALDEAPDDWDNDDDDWEKTKPPRNILDAIFIPQMTFRCMATDAIDIMKEIVNKDPEYKVGKKAIKAHVREYDDVVKVEKMVDDLLAEYNKTAIHPVSLSTNIGKSLKCYVFLIFYKIYNYLQNHKDLVSRTYYLKDFLTYASRHSNYDIYVRIKEILRRHYHIRTTKKIHEFFYQPNVLKSLYDFETYEENDFDKKGNYIYGNGLKDRLKKSNKNYGNPLYSLSSYFEFFEKPLDSEYVPEWFIYSKTDVFSTTFDIKNDIILLENRYFKDEVGLWLRNHVNSKIHGTQLNIREMYQLVSALYGENIKQLKNLEMNMKEKKLTKKCKPGFKRTTDLKCEKSKHKTMKNNKSK
jgi:hypothetical protein